MFVMLITMFDMYMYIIVTNEAVICMN